MRISETALDLIREFEGLRLGAYPDPGSGGDPWTIGYGHTGPDVKPGMRITLQQADELLEEDVLRFEREVASLVKVPLTQNKFDALVCFAFNLGSDIDADTIPEGLGDSTLLRKVNAGDFDGAALEFVKWNKSKGRVMAGLTRRRNAEAALFRGERRP